MPTAAAVDAFEGLEKEAAMLAAVSQISECLNPAVTRYVITWARVELICT